MIPVEDMRPCRWCRETKPAAHDCVGAPAQPVCTCPPDHEHDWHAEGCPKFYDCGGWRWHEDPPCGGCDRCLIDIDAHYAYLASQDPDRDTP